MALLLGRRSFEISSYTNPCSDNFLEDINESIYDAFFTHEQEARTKAGLEPLLVHSSEDKKLPYSATELLEMYPHAITQSRTITQWYNFITSWMPETAEKWWLEQFNTTNEHLDGMPEEFWHQRTRNFIFAHEKDDINKPLGAVALTKVYLHERHTAPQRVDFSLPLFYEIRGLVVDESRRGEGIGEALVIEALRLAIKSGADIPTFANTSNEAAANMFIKLGGTEEEPENFLFKGADLHRLFACWLAHENTPKKQCKSCPMRDGTTSFWPTRPDPTPVIEL